MQPFQLRQEIINVLHEYFEPKSYVLAYWLGGSDANDETDEYSDIDCIFCVKDGQEETVLQEAKKALSSLGAFDYVENIDYRKQKTSQTFHMAGHPEHLLIEIMLVPESKGMIFTEGHPAFKPKIIFDKANIISFQPLDRELLRSKIREQIAEQKNLMMESSRAMKYVQRGEYIEATNYYIKYVFLPLVSVLRIKHTPLLHDWLRIHISRHFPRDVVQRLENLMRFSSLDDISENIPLAREWFWETIQEIENGEDVE